MAQIQTQTQAATTTVVGVFEDYNAAERASRQLAEAGIPRDSIEVQSNLQNGAAGNAAYGDNARSEEGGFMGWLNRVFGSGDDDYARREGDQYAEAVRRGSAVVSVNTTEDMADTATRVMNSAGAIDIDERAARWREGGYTGYEDAAKPYTPDQVTAGREKLRGDGERESIPVIEEELQVGKRVVKRGGVRVYSRIVERPVDEQVNLREEHVRVERRPVNRPVSDAELSGLRDQSIELTETAEEAVIGKRARVKEEVIVGKETTERTQHVHDTLRHTEVQVDRLNDTDATGYDAAAYEYGTSIAREDRYRGRNWSDVENDLRSDYTRTRPGSAWDKVKDSVRRGWDEVTGKR